MIRSLFLIRNQTITSNALPKFFSSAVSTESEPLEHPPAPEPEQKKRDVPLIVSRSLDFPSKYQSARQAWVENLDTTEEQKLGTVDLHPDVFAAMPRLDILHKNIVWQQKYRYVNFANTKTRAEVRGGGRKPWPQKGLGKARHGSIRSPLWKGGGVAHGPRNPTPHFYMLPFYERVFGLRIALSVKLAQDDLHVVDSLDIPTDDSQYIENLIDERGWGMSTLFVDETDIMPRNITSATDQIDHVNLMPVYGLNVYSMLKHETLVLTLGAVDRIEEKLLYHLHRNDGVTPGRKFKLNQV